MRSAETSPHSARSDVEPLGRTPRGLPPPRRGGRGPSARPASRSARCAPRRCRPCRAAASPGASRLAAAVRRAPRPRRAPGRRARQRLDELARLQAIGRVVAGVDVLELARREVEAGGERGHEHGALVVAARAPVHPRDAAATDARAWHDRAEERLGHRHEERRADALARDVADQQPDPLAVGASRRRGRRPPARGPQPACDVDLRRARETRAAASPSGCRGRAPARWSSSRRARRLLGERDVADPHRRGRGERRQQLEVVLREGLQPALRAQHDHAQAALAVEERRREQAAHARDDDALGRRRSARRGSRR